MRFARSNFSKKRAARLKATKRHRRLGASGSKRKPLVELLERRLCLSVYYDMELGASGYAEETDLAEVLTPAEIERLFPDGGSTFVLSVTSVEPRRDHQRPWTVRLG